jgi:MFS family permease
VRLRDWVGALAERDFRLFFIGQATSQIGSGMAPVAITFAVLAHGSASALGLVSAAGLVPVVVLLLIGGVIADRWSRRLVMLNSDLLRTLGELGLGAWILLGRPPLWGFMSLAAVVGIGSSIFYPAMNGLIPQVISKGNLQQANALQSLSGSVAGVIGPALAGVIVAVSSPGWAVLIDGLTYLVSVLSLFLLSIEWIPNRVAESFLSELKQGWSEFWSRTWLWVIVVEFSIVNVLESAPFFVLGPVIAKQSLGGAPAWGAVLAAGGAGAILGGIVMLRWRPARPLLIATVASLSFVLPLFALADRAPVLMLGAASLVGGVGSAVFGTLWATTMQREIPSAVLSRVSAYDMFGSLLFLPIGMAVVGPISKVLSEDRTLAGSALLLTGLVAVTLCVPSVTRMRVPGPNGQPSDPEVIGDTIDHR